MYIHCHGIFATYTPFCFPNPQVSLVTKISWFCLERFDGNVIQEAHNLAGHPQIASLVYRLTMVRSSTQFHFYVYYVFYTHIYIYIYVYLIICVQVTMVFIECLQLVDVFTQSEIGGQHLVRLRLHCSGSTCYHVVTSLFSYESIYPTHNNQIYNHFLK